MKNVIYFLTISFILSACSKDSLSDEINSANLITTNVKSFTPPELLIKETSESDILIEVVAGENGATGGLSIRWMTLEDYDDSGWNNELAGHVLLNGRSNEEYSLEKGEVFKFKLSNYVAGTGTSWNRPLECGQSYVFIAQAHQDGKIKKSKYSDPFFSHTEACDDDCNLLKKDIYSKTYTEAEVLEFINDEALNLKFLWLDLLEEGAPLDGEFNNAKIIELYRYYVSEKRAGSRSISLTYIYTVQEENCIDSAELTLVITN